MRSTRRANLWSMPSGSFCLLLRLACLSRTVSWIRGVDTLSALSLVYLERARPGYECVHVPAQRVPLHGRAPLPLRGGRHGQCGRSADAGWCCAVKERQTMLVWW